MTDGVSNCRDLKRDVAKKLEKLERRTQRAIAELIRQYSSLMSAHMAAVISSHPYSNTLRCLLSIADGFRPFQTSEG